MESIMEAGVRSGVYDSQGNDASAGEDRSVLGEHPKSRIRLKSCGRPAREVEGGKGMCKSVDSSLKECAMLSDLCEASDVNRPTKRIDCAEIEIAQSFAHLGKCKVPRMVHGLLRYIVGNGPLVML